MTYFCFEQQAQTKQRFARETGIPYVQSEKVQVERHDSKSFVRKGINW